MIKTNTTDYVRHAKNKPQMLTHIRTSLTNSPSTTATHPFSADTRAVQTAMAWAMSNKQLLAV